LYDDPAKVVFRGYFLTLWEFTGATVPKGGGFDAYPEQRPIAPLPAPLLGWVPEELPEPSRTAQAIEWLKAEPGRTQAEAARLFGITSAGICVAAKAAGLVQSRAPSRTAQAIEWLKAEPGRTQAEAARLFGCTHPTYPQNWPATATRDEMLTPMSESQHLSNTARARLARRLSDKPSTGAACGVSIYRHIICGAAHPGAWAGMAHHYIICGLRRYFAIVARYMLII